MEQVCVKLHATEAKLQNTGKKLASAKEKLACTEEDLKITTDQLFSTKDSLETTKMKHRDTCNELTAVQQKLFATEQDLESARAGLFDAREKLNNEQFRNKHLEEALEAREVVTKKQETALKQEHKAYVDLDQKVRSIAIDMNKETVSLYDESRDILDVIRDDGIKKELDLKMAREGMLDFQRALGDLTKELFKVLTGKGTNEQKVIDAKDIAIRIDLLKGTLNPQ